MSAYHHINTASDCLQVIQLTDPHIFAEVGQTFDGVDTEQSLLSVIEAINNLDWQPDLFLLTGDLVHDPVKPAYDRLLGILNRLNHPVFCLPGNHDDPGLMHALLNSGNVSTGKQISSPFWQISMLDTYVINTHSGLLATEELQWLDTQLKEQGDKHHLIALHHHPITIDSPWMDDMMLDNPAELFAILKKYPRVKAVIWGHIHQEYQNKTDGIHLLGCPSTCIQFRPKASSFLRDEQMPGFREIQLNQDGSINTHVYRVVYL